MFDSDATLKSYRQADAQTRLDLFLNHRGLREKFDRAEFEERKPPTATTRNHPVLAPAWRLVRKCCSWVV